MSMEYETTMQSVLLAQEKEQECYNNLITKDTLPWTRAKDICNHMYATYDTDYLIDYLETESKRIKCELEYNDTDCDETDFMTPTSIIINGYKNKVSENLYFKGHEMRYLIENFKMPVKSQMRKQSWGSYLYSFYSDTTPESYKYKSKYYSDFDIQVINVFYPNDKLYSISFKNRPVLEFISGSSK